MNFTTNQTICYAGNSAIPRKGSATSAGYDLTADADYSIAAGERAAIGTGLRLALPGGWYGKIEGRSGLAFKHGLYCFGGVIDSDYRGEIKALLANSSQMDYHVKKGDRIAQIIIQPHWNGVFQRQDRLSPTVRGEAGFGSTGTTDLRQPTLAEMWSVPDGRTPQQLNQELAGLSAYDIHPIKMPKCE